MGSKDVVVLAPRRSLTALAWILFGGVFVVPLSKILSNFLAFFHCCLSAMQNVLFAFVFFGGISSLFWVASALIYYFGGDVCWCSSRGVETRWARNLMRKDKATNREGREH